MPRDKMMTVINVSTGRLPPLYRSQPTGRMAIRAAGTMEKAVEIPNWLFFIQL